MIKQAKLLLIAATVCAGASFSAGVWAQSADAFPDRAITLIAPMAPGGNTDIALRELPTLRAQPRQAHHRRQPAGAGGRDRPQNMDAGAKPDGYTLSQIRSAFSACRIW